LINFGLIKEFENDGVCVVPNVLEPEEVFRLKKELKAATEEDLRNESESFDKGMVHNCMFRGEAMLSLLDHPVMNKYVKKLLAPSCIVYAYQSSTLFPGRGNYGTRVHVDSPRFIKDYLTNIGIIFPLDDFTHQNGATRYLPRSQLESSLPNLTTFNENARAVECRAGDMIIFNARLAHSAGVNRTKAPRYALTINFCRCYMRQRFDFARMISPQQLQSLGENGKRLIGWDVRVPTSLEEFYLPPDQRLYKPGQE
jgi:ectoine hydroxylase-related dioxygenase (phytanoyl-CoA dioxygenase family)